MLKSVSRSAAVVLSGSAIALAAVLPAQAAATTAGWRAVSTVAIKGHTAIMSGIDAVSAKDAWAAGFAATSSGSKAVGLVEHWAGKSWRAVKLPAKTAKKWAGLGPTSVLVGASSPTNVWAFNEYPGTKGENGYLRLSGRTWTTGVLPRASASSGHFVVITATEVLGKAGTWAFGGTMKVSGTSTSFAPYAAYFNGHRWATVKVPGTSEITAVSAISAKNIWAVTGISGIAWLLGGGSQGSPPVTSEVLHWNGTSWQTAAVQPTGLPAGGDLTAVLASSKRVLVGGDVATSTGGTAVQFADTFAGGTWAAVTDLPSSGASAGASEHMPYQIESLVADGSGSYLALSGNMNPVAPKLWHYASGKWSATASPTFGNKHRSLFQLAAVPRTRSVWAAGTVGPQSKAKAIIALTGPTPR